MHQAALAALKKTTWQLSTPHKLKKKSKDAQALEVSSAK